MAEAAEKGGATSSPTPSPVCSPAVVKPPSLKERIIHGAKKRKEALIRRKNRLAESVKTRKDRLLRSARERRDIVVQWFLRNWHWLVLVEPVALVTGACNVVSFLLVMNAVVFSVGPTQL